MSSRATFADILTMSPPDLTPGRQTLTVLAVYAPGGRYRIKVRNSRGEEGHLSLGADGTLTRRLRVLLGSKAPGPCPQLEDLRAALVDKHFEVRLTAENYSGYEYLEMRKP